MNDDYFIWVYSGNNVKVLVPRGTPYEEIEDRVNKERNRLMWAELSRNYILTHGPWNLTTNRCLTCGKGAIDIHYNRSICGGTETQSGE